MATAPHDVGKMLNAPSGEGEDALVDRLAGVMVGRWCRSTPG